MQALLDCVHALATKAKVIQQLLCVLVAHQAGQDGRQLALQAQEALDEGRGGHLDTALVRAVDLEVVAVGRVQAQEAPGLARVHAAAEALAQLLCLAAPCRC